jgi:hypothetical protein
MFAGRFTHPLPMLMPNFNPMDSAQRVGKGRALAGSNPKQFRILTTLTGI